MVAAHADRGKSGFRPPNTIPGAPPLSRASTPLGVRCPKCGAGEFKTSLQRFKDGTEHVRADCARCKAFVRYLKQDDGPDFERRPCPSGASAYATDASAESSWWLGYIRPDDGTWYAIALAPTNGRCWDALLHSPLQGELLVVPTLPPKRGAK